jgi:CrcB protein
MFNLGLVATGGAIGAAARHLLNLGALRLFGPGFPAGTLVVNILGCLLMGVLAGALTGRSDMAGQGLWLLLATGVLGGFTTFSAFSLDTVLLWERGAAMVAIGYVLASVLTSIGALIVGLSLARAFT